jgi:uncharacterized membrane protein
MNKYLKESVLWVFVLTPYAYLLSIWDKLPEQVPTHFNIDGVANDWSSRSSLLFLPCAIPIIIYFVLLIIPAIDPKKKIQEMGEKYYSFRFMTTFFVSLIEVYTLYISNSGSIKSPFMLYAIIGAVFIMLGNYFQAVRPNYFIGIRTPWTLENEQVWKKTHRLGGRLFMLGGILIAILAFFIHNQHTYFFIFGAIIVVVVVVPYVFSYTEFQKGKMLDK